MAQTDYTITIDDAYVTPEGEFTTKQQYLTFVLNKAAESYRNAYGVMTNAEGIQAALDAYNAALPQDEEVVAP